MIEEPTQLEINDVERAIVWAHKHHDEWVRISTRVAEALLPNSFPERLKQLKRQAADLRAELDAVREQCRIAEKLLFDEREKCKLLNDLAETLRAEVAGMRG